jgi:fluoroquinolone transport system permease protein
MKKLIRTIAWDLKLAVTYQILTVAAAITLLYIVSFHIIPGNNLTPLLVILIFTDPTMLGFIFIGAMILFEKSAHTLEAVVVTPLKPWQYLWSKALSLTLISLACSLVMAIAGHGWNFNYLFFIPAVVFSSLLFIFIGFIGVARVNTFNQYIIIIPFFLTPAAIPLVSYLNLSDSFLFYLIPTQGSLLLFKASFETVKTWQLIYSILYLILSVFISFLFAKRAFRKQIVQKTV